MDVLISPITEMVGRGLLSDEDPARTFTEQHVLNSQPDDAAQQQSRRLYLILASFCKGGALSSAECGR